jgi:ATP-binding cassette, subfamily B, multidrug efflux pump
VSLHDDDPDGRAYDHRLMRRLLAWLRPHRGRVLLAGVVVLLEAVTQLAGPALTAEAIDHGIGTHNLTRLEQVAVIYFLVLSAGFGLGWLQQQMLQRVGQRVMMDLRTALFRQLQRLPVSYYDRHAVGRLMARVTNDVDVLNELVTAGTIALFGDMFALIGIVVAMLWLSPELMGVTFSVLPLIVIITLLFRTRVRRTFREVRAALARLNAFLNESLGGMLAVQALNLEARRHGEFDGLNAVHRDANLRAVRTHAVFFPLLELCGALAVSLIIWYGGRQVMWRAIHLGTLVAFIQYTQRFFRPVSDLSEKYTTLQQAMASSERIFDLLDTPADPGAPELPVAGIPAPQAAAAPAPGDASRAAPDVMANGRAAANGAPAPAVPPARMRVRGLIEFDHVTFAYDGVHPVLRDVTFTVRPGEKVALAGATGSGKTTIASLLLGFYRPGQGQIRVDGRPLEQWSMAALRRDIGLVLQDPFLFSGTIASNLAFGDGALTRAGLERAAHDVRAHGFIARLPGGYDAEVRERGATLSGGERQLVAFARTLAHDPRVLVLDEATSSVDPETESAIQSGLAHLVRGRTAIVIAHRLMTLRGVDRILVLHHGGLREQGTHAELLARGGIYARLYELQTLATLPHAAATAGVPRCAAADDRAAAAPDGPHPVPTPGA